MQKKIAKLLARYAEVEAQLGNPDILQDQKQYRALTQEHAYLSEVKNTTEDIDRLNKQITENQELLKSEKDPEFGQLLKDDINLSQTQVSSLQQKLENLLIPPDPRDHRNIILELRAGTGGEEAALFVADCVRMYRLFADTNQWRCELLSCTESDRGGYKEYIMSMSGNNVNRFMQYEAGTHRVQRVPETEAQGRIHTSAITLAVLLEPEEESDIVVDEKDLRIDTYRSSGAGGQHVNTTDSAVRITHIPSGIVVYCQEERSQHKNRDKAMRWLKAELAERKRKQQEEEIASTRSQQVGSGDRSERIRTYNFPQNRVTDHRINVTLYSLDRVMEGHLEGIVNPLVAHFRQSSLD